jgi:hypothetical protein
MSIEPNGRKGVIMKRVVITTCLFAVCGLTWAADWVVPDQYATIQEAVTAAANEDTVIIRPGTYSGLVNININPAGKAITIRSEDPMDPNIVAETVIDVGFAHGFVFDSMEMPETKVQGLTIRNGMETMGSGIYCIMNSNPTIEYCVIENNTAFMYGGGVYADSFSAPVLNNCVIRNNTSFTDGGGLALMGGSAILNSCVITGNSAARGAGMLYLGSSEPIVQNCTFADNVASVLASGIYCEGENYLTVSDSIFWGNTSLETAQQDTVIHVANQGLDTLVYLGYCDIEGMAVTADNPDVLWFGEGLIDVDPLFVQRPGVDDLGQALVADYHLQPDSPCIDAGDPMFAMYPGQTDIDGEVRLQGDTVDMGADELFVQKLATAKVWYMPHKVLHVGYGFRCFMAYVRLDDLDLDIRTTDVDSIAVNETVLPYRVWKLRNALLMKFDHRQIEELLVEGQTEVTLTLTGTLEDGTQWSGEDTLKVFVKPKPKPRRHWWRWHW